MSKALSRKERTKWFREAKLGAFIHFGPYAQYGRGEQVLFREARDQNEYADRAMTWTVPNFDADAWAEVFANAGSRYTVMTTRHHDGFCMWDTKTTNYSSVHGKAQRDFIGEYVAAVRKKGLRVGLYYSLADWRVPAYFAGPENDPEGWKEFTAYVHEQIRELLTNYGQIDILWFDGSWPNYAEDWGGIDLINEIRRLQPGIIINNRLGEVKSKTFDAGSEEGVGGNLVEDLADFGTPERHIQKVEGWAWEACDNCTWRLWGYAEGERFFSPAIIIDRVVQAISMGGNFLLNVGPKPDGTLPEAYLDIMEELGTWVRVNGEAIFGVEEGDIAESVTEGYQLRKGNSLYCVRRFMRNDDLYITGIKEKAIRATLLGSNEQLTVTQDDTHIIIGNLPEAVGSALLPVIRVDFDAQPKAFGMFKDRLWCGDAARMVPWAKARRTGARVTDYA